MKFSADTCSLVPLKQHTCQKHKPPSNTHVKKQWGQCGRRGLEHAIWSGNNQLNEDDIRGLKSVSMNHRSI
jgi:hypothetical protein